MARETESWWSGNYAKYSLRDLKTLPIYSKFKTYKVPFTRSEGNKTESFWTVDNADIYEWFLASEATGEKLGFDSFGKTWFYEIWHPEPDHHLVVKTWLNSAMEWGVIIKRYPGKEVKETWKLERGAKTYEIVEVNGTRVTSRRSGFTPLADGVDEWTEETTEEPEEMRLERTWERPGAKGGETRTQRGALRSGRIWKESPDDSEEKIWNVENTREWGSIAGIKGAQKYNQKWDIDGSQRLETKTYQEGERNWGSRQRVEGPRWYKEEWEGLVPESGAPSPDYSRRLYSVYEDAMATLRDSESTLEQLLDSASDSELLNLRAQRKTIRVPQAEEVEELLRAVSKVHELLRRHEQLKREKQDHTRTGGASLLPALRELANKAQADLDVLATGPVTAALKEAEAALLTQSRILDSGLVAEELTNQTLRLMNEQAALKQQFTTQLLARGKELKRSADHTKSRLQEIVASSGNPKAEELLSQLDFSDEGGALQDLAEALLSQLASSPPEVDVKQDCQTDYLELVSDYMQLLYAIMLKNDSVSDTLADSLKDSDTQAKLDHFEGEFERINQEFDDTRDPKKVTEMLKLLLLYQPINYELAGRLRGLSSEQSAEDMKELGKPTLKNQRTKVRSGRPTASPFDQILARLNENLNVAVSISKSLGMEEGLYQPAEDVQQEVGEPISATMKRLDVLFDLLNQLVDQAAAYEESIRTEVSSTTEETTTEYTIAIERKDGEILALKKQMEKKENLAKEWNKELEDLRPVKLQWKQAEEDLAVTKKQQDVLKREIATLKEQLKGGSDLAEKLTALQSRLDQAEQQAQSSVKDVEQQKQLAHSYQDMADQTKKQLNHAYEKSTQDAKAFHEEIESLKLTLEDLEARLKHEATDRKHQSAKRLVQSIAWKLKIERILAFSNWRISNAEAPTLPLVEESKRESQE